VVVTMEDHVLPGGYGSTVLELLADKAVTTPVVRIGWPDQFIEHASSVDYLRKKHGLTVDHAIGLVKEKLGDSAATVRRIAA
jgi:1-deoxy-D-xylulose-5-phosphate synthase